MKFIHLADCHIDGYRDAKLAALGFENFTYVITQAITEQVDFVLIAGDLFNTALPRVDALKDTTTQLKRLKDANIPVYFIPGSHDYSPHGKTMLDVLEIAGLGINVMKGTVENGKLKLQLTVDPKTNTHITGIPGRKGMLDKMYYTNLDTTSLQTPKEVFSIFMFHTTLSELKPKEMDLSDDTPMNFLPQGFNYYAGGHVHIRKRFSNQEYNNVVYPGPTFPNSFSELEALKTGTYIMYDDTTEDLFTHIEIPQKKVISIALDLTGLEPAEAQKNITSAIEEDNIQDAIVLLRLTGKLEGKPQEIDFQDIQKLIVEQGAFTLLRSTSKLTSSAYEEVIIHEDSQNKIETKAIEEHLGQIQLPKDYDEKETITTLLKELASEQYDGEKKAIYNERIVEAAQSIFSK
jgi:hypothetical protein